MRRLRKIALWTSGAAALYAILGFLVAPPIARHQIERALGEQLGRKAAVESVRINPFALSASVRNLALKEADGSADAVGFEELNVNIALASLFRLGVVVESATLVKPFVRIALLENGKHSFQDVVERLAKAPSGAADASPARFAVYNVTVTDGRIDFDDRPARTKHAVTDLQVGLPFVSSLPGEVDLVVQPRLAAKINGSPFEVAGETKPFKHTHEATLRIDVDQLELAKYLAYVPLRVRVASGTLTTRLVLTSISGRSGQLQTLALSGAVSLERVAVRQADGGPLAALGKLSVDLETVDFLKRHAAVKAVSVEALELDIVRGKDGDFNLQGVAPAQSAAAPAERAPESREPPFAVAIQDVRLSRGQVRFVDRTPAQPARVELNDIALLTAGLSSDPKTRADLRLSGRINRAAPMEVAGKVHVLSSDVFIDLVASVRDVDLRPLSPYSIMYAGYAIGKGSFSAKHVVKLEKRMLGTENSIRVDQFTLGERVDSPTATRLPVALAIAVLKDRNGVIAIDLPVSTSLDNPEAGGGKVIGREVGGVIGKAASEPFAVLGGEGLAYLEFVPGTVVLEAGAEAKLKTLAQALYDRPGLKLEVSGRADPGADGVSLAALAGARAQAARDWLVGNGKIAAERVSIGAPRLDAEGIKDKGKPTRVDFALK